MLSNVGGKKKNEKQKKKGEKKSFSKIKSFHLLLSLLKTRMTYSYRADMVN